MAIKFSKNDAPIEPTRHGGEKRVILRHDEMDSPTMFMNECYVKPGEEISKHAHSDMEEVFYFIEGMGVMEVGNETYTVASGDRFIMPARVEHCLKNTGDTLMRFICFGVKENKYLESLYSSKS